MRLRRLAGLALLLILVLPMSIYSQQISYPPGSASIVTREPLCVAVSQTLTTVGTSKEQLVACTIPANSFPTAYVGFEYEAGWTGAANANNKTPGVDFPALAGTGLNALVSNVSGQTWGFTMRCQVATATSLACHGSQSVEAGTTSGNYYAFEVTALDFTTSMSIVFVATTPSAAGDVVLRAYAVYLLGS